MADNTTVSNKMPRGIPYIIGNELAERFSYYGMKTILVVFMTHRAAVVTDPLGFVTQTLYGTVGVVPRHVSSVC